MSSLSIIIPTLNESTGIIAALSALSPLRRAGAEIIIADGGSHDDTIDLARPFSDKMATSPRGRGAQMNAGAALARGDVFLFLHADTRLPADAGRIILDGLQSSNALWGRFDVTIEGEHPLLPIIATMMNLRSRLTGIATGDQAFFVTRAAFARASGFPDIPLMEDVAFAKTMKRISRPLCLRARVTTSGRRWEKHGVVRTILLMWRLRLDFFLGVAPSTLARRYGYAPRES